jgi:hypothetical protein
VGLIAINQGKAVAEFLRIQKEDLKFVRIPKPSQPSQVTGSVPDMEDLLAFGPTGSGVVTIWASESGSATNCTGYNAS